MKKLWVLLLVSFLWTVSCSPKPDIKKLTQQAQKGDADAQYNLGVMYENGQGVPQDYIGNLSNSLIHDSKTKKKKK